jgi:hypothetical protein
MEEDLFIIVSRRKGILLENTNEGQQYPIATLDENATEISHNINRWVSEEKHVIIPWQRSLTT